MPVFRWLDKVFGIARDVKAFLYPGGGPADGAATNAQRREERSRNRKEARRRASEQRKKLASKRRETKRELSGIKTELDAAKDKAGKGAAERSEQMRRARKKRQELLRLKSELRAAKKGAEAEEPGTGALPDFVVIGAGRSGTSFFYNLLSQHPHVEPAAKKELHYFDLLFEAEDVEWYRQCFPQPRLKDGHRTISGEATPYMSSQLAPQRMAEVIPEAKLIALLRNPVDRAYSDYQQVTRKGRETRTFEEAMDYENLDDAPRKFLSKSIYVDQLLRWSEFFDREQMLVLKSEDFFEDPAGTLKPVLSFLDLPEWKPKVWDLHYKRNKGDYEGGMDPATRRRLEEYFEPHNRRLYDFLGQDFGW